MSRAFFDRSHSPRRSNLSRPRQFETLERRDLMAYLGQIGGPGQEGWEPSTVDAAGNFYVTGYIEGTADVDPTDDGVVNLTASDGNRFIARYHPDGTLDWTRQFDVKGKTTKFDAPFAVVHGITVDSTGTYLVGRFAQQVDFFGNGTYVSSVDGSNDIFIVKVDSNTGDTIWAMPIGGKFTDQGRGIAVLDGYLYVTGYFAGTVDFDPGLGTQNLTAYSYNGKGGSSNFDGFVLKLDAATGAYEHAWKISGPGSEHGHNIVADGGTLFVSGLFSDGADFDPGSNTRTLTTPDRDRFFASYTTSGAFNWVQGIGHAGTHDLLGLNLAADATGLYVSAHFSETMIGIDPSNLDFQVVPHGARDLFVAKYSKTTGQLDSQFAVWQLGTSTTSVNTYQTTMVVDASSAVYVGTGLSPEGVVKLDANGNPVDQWQIGAWAAPAGIANDTLYVVGTFSDTATFPTGESLTSFGGSDIYIMAIDQTPSGSGSTALAFATLAAPAPSALAGSRMSAASTDGSADANARVGETDMQTEPSSLDRRVQAARMAVLEIWSSERRSTHPRRGSDALDWAVERSIQASNEAWDAALEALV